MHISKAPRESIIAIYESAVIKRAATTELNGNILCLPHIFLLPFFSSGRNGVIVDMALLCKEKKLNVIALTNLEHTYAGASRHKSGKRLCEIADIVLDNFGCVGDACVEVDGIEGKICPTSTVTGALILNAIVAEAVDTCAKRGFNPEHFASSNVDGGDAINNALINKYKKEIRHL